MPEAHNSAAREWLRPACLARRRITGIGTPSVPAELMPLRAMPETFLGSACAHRAATISEAVIWILHGEQEQPLGGGGGAGALWQRRHPAQVAAPGFDQRAHHVAHHMFQETT